MAKTKLFGLSIPMLLVVGGIVYLLTRKEGQPEPPEPPEPLEGQPAPPDGMGDIDGDGRVTTEDARMAAIYRMGKITLTAEQQRRADVNRDGKINVVDATFIAQFAEGSIKSF